MGIGEKNEDHKLVKKERLWWSGRLLANHKHTQNNDRSYL